MREIEVKYKVRDAMGLERELAARGASLSAPYMQDDQAYAPRGWVFGQPKLGVTFARLRTEHDTCVFTVKTPLDNEMACVEHETVIADREQMHHALIAMGFAPTVQIVKTRRSARLAELAVCIDDVEHAGLFFEVEKLVRDDGCPVTVQDELDNFARSLGVALERATATYDTLVAAALSGTSGECRQRHSRGRQWFAGRIPAGAIAPRA